MIDANGDEGFYRERGHSTGEVRERRRYEDKYCQGTQGELNQIVGSADGQYQSDQLSRTNRILQKQLTTTQVCHNICAEGNFDEIGQIIEIVEWDTRMAKGKKRVGKGKGGIRSVS